MEDNQKEVLLDDEAGLFDDFADEDMPIDSENEGEEATVDETSEEEVAGDDQQETESFLQIKYNKEEIGLTKEEAKELAEKGKNYDVLRDKFNNLNSTIEQLARRSGMSTEQFLQTMVETRNKVDIDDEAKAIKNQYPDLPEDILNELAKRRVEEKNGQQEKQKVLDDQKKNDDKRNEIKRQIDVFKKHYPNLEADKLDESVYELMDSGYSLLEAYSIYKMGQESKNNATNNSVSRVRKLQESNKQKSYGNIVNSGNVDEDDFLNGFNS